MRRKQAEDWIKELNLQIHPEGGYFRETFVSHEQIRGDALADRYGAARKYYTSIYFLLHACQVSHFHRIKSDEIWTFHTGSALDIHVIDPSGKYFILSLGLNTENGEMPQHLVSAGCWFGASIPKEENYSLVGCIVAPGFDFDDFELADRNKLLGFYPEHKEIIKKLTPGK